VAPDEPSSAPVSEPADAAPGTAPAAASEPAPSASRLGTLQDAFRRHPDALKDRGSDGKPRGSDASDESPEESAPPPSITADASGASKPGEQPGAPSRRGAAAKISEQQSEIDRLVTEREAEKARAAEVESRVQAQDRARESARKAALSRIGDDQEFAQLSTRRMRGEVLSYEDDEKLSSMLAWREHAADLWEMTDRAHKTALARAVSDRVDRYGLDRGVAYDAPLPELLDHAVSVTEARVRKEQANEIAELKAELKGLRTRGAARATPTLGGASAGSGDGMPDDGAAPMDWFRAGARRAEAGAAAPSRRFQSSPTAQR
jgi:hypothetical protein